jgi:poly(hydroxyalkanoate) granule-associated protein
MASLKSSKPYAKVVLNGPAATTPTSLFQETSMAKKTVKAAPKARVTPINNPLVKVYVEGAQKYAEGAQKVWFAGVGAVARVQAEGEKVVAIVAKEARVLEAHGKQLVEARTSAVRTMAESRAAQTREMTSTYTTRVVEAVETRVAEQSQRVLGMLGVPTSQNIRDLTVAIEQLKKDVSSLQKARRAA